MLENLGEEKAAGLIEQAVIDVLMEDKIRTKDLGGNSNTTEMGDAVVNKLTKIV